MDAAVRSFPPVDPLAIRWDFPLWGSAEDVDPTALRGRKTDGQSKQEARDREGKDDILTALENGPTTRKQLRAALGMGFDRVNKLVHQLIKDEEAELITIDEQEHLQILSRSAGLL